MLNSIDPLFWEAGLALSGLGFRVHQRLNYHKYTIIIIIYNQNPFVSVDRAGPDVTLSGV